MVIDKFGVFVDIFGHLLKQILVAQAGFAPVSGRVSLSLVVKGVQCVH